MSRQPASVRAPLRLATLATALALPSLLASARANECLPREVLLPDWSVQLARLDSDAWPDLILVHRATAVSLRLRGASTGSFGVPEVQQLDGVEPVGARTFVLTRDGRDDVVLLAHGLSTLETRVTESTGRLRTPVRSHSGYHPVALDVGDITLDGFEDVVVAWLLRPLISLHRSYNGTLQPVAYHYPLTRAGRRFTVLDVAVAHWLEDPAPEVAALGLREGEGASWLLYKIRDLGAEFPPLEFVEVEAIDFALPFRQMDRLRTDPLAGSGLVLWDPTLTTVVTITPGPVSQTAEFSLVAAPATVAAADLSADSLDDLVVLDTSRSSVQVYLTVSGVPILIVNAPLPGSAEAIALLPTGPSLEPQLWIVGTPLPDGSRDLLRFAISLSGISLLQTHRLPPLQSPWGGLPNVVLESPRVPESPEASAAQKWTTGIGDWTVAAAFTDSAHLQADVRTWSGPHVLGAAEPFVIALPTTVSLGPTDRIEVNGRDPAQSQVFFGTTHAQYDTPIVVSPPAGYYPAGIELRVRFLPNTYPLQFLLSQGPPPELNWTEEGIIPVPASDLFCVAGSQGLQIGPMLPYPYAVGPRPGPDPDVDQDDLSDAWEFFFFGSLLPAADEDPDQDQFDNAAELAAVTHPLNPASNPDEPTDPPVPADLSLARQGAELVLSWLNDAGVTYTVQSAPRPDGSWADRAQLLPDPTPDLVRQWRQPLPDLAGSAFYRVLGIR